MEVKQLEVFSESSNYGIVRMPGRSFPGCVVQGDSLSILCGLALSIAKRAEKVADADFRDEVAELVDLLLDRLRHYEQVLANHELPLPYRSPSP